MVAPNTAGSSINIFNRAHARHYSTARACTKKVLVGTIDLRKFLDTKLISTKSLRHGNFQLMICVFYTCQFFVFYMPTKSCYRWIHYHLSLGNACLASTFVTSSNLIIG